MNDKKKNYTLYLKLKGEDLELLKGTLSEIDDFTTCFETSDAMYRKLTNSSAEDNNYEFYIKSSKNNRYPVLYYKYRNLLNSSNVDLIMSYLKQMQKEELISFLENYTQVAYYKEKDLNNNQIPLCKLYNDLTNDLDYKFSLDNYIKSNYNNYRLASTYVIDRSDIKLSSFPFNDLNIVKKTISETNEVISSVLTGDKNQDKPIFDSHNNEFFDKNIESLDDKIYSIIENDNLETYEKEVELEMLIDDEDKLRSAKDLLYQKKM